LLLNLSNKTKINFGRKKNLQREKKNKLSIMQETYMYCDIRYETLLYTILYGYKV